MRHIIMYQNVYNVRVCVYNFVYTYTTDTSVGRSDDTSAVIVIIIRVVCVYEYVSAGVLLWTCDDVVRFHDRFFSHGMSDFSTVAVYRGHGTI